MKNFFTAFLLILAAGALSAQLTINVSGTVTDPMGTGVANVDIMIYTDSFPTGGVYSNVVQTDVNGDYSDSFQVPTFLTQGVFWVTMVDCNGNYLTQMFAWNPGSTDFTADFVYCANGACDVAVTATQVPGTILYNLAANATGAAPFTYSWSTGETTQTITVDTSGTYCVTITDNTGCESSDCVTVVIGTGGGCDVTIQNNPAGPLTAVASGQAPFSYLWNTGQTTQVIQPNASGTYCVTITDASGCTSSDCYVYDPMGGDSCSLFLVQVGPFIEAVGYGAMPYTIVWSNGAVGDSIVPLLGGTYCATLTDAEGCTSTDCLVFDPDTTCSVSLYSFPVQGSTGYQVGVAPNGAPPFTYLWSTGETTANIFVNSSGTYCVTVTDANGCEAEDCLTLALIDQYQVSGIVWPGDTINNIPLVGLAYLIVYDPMAGTLTAIDTVPLQNTPFGFSGYDFGDVPAGDYLVKVALDPSSPGYATNLPTYYVSELFWNNAASITVPYVGVAGFDVFLVQGNNPGGPGFIGGSVDDGANFGGGNEEAGQSGGSSPLEGISILLLNEFDDPIAHTATDANGEFGFDNLAWGTYQVIVEVVGLEQGITWVTIGPDNPTAQVHFEVTEEGITTGILEQLARQSLALFPNPATEQLNLVLDAPEAAQLQVQIVAATGQILSSRVLELSAGRNQLALEVRDLPSGVYFLQLTEGEAVLTTRWIKQ